MKEEPSYVEELESIKREFHIALQDSEESDSDETSSNLFTMRQKSAAEKVYSHVN